MVFILLGIALGIYLGTREDVMGWEPTIFDYFFSSCLASIFGGIAGIIIASILPMKTEWVSSYSNLGSMQDNSHLKGGFFLGSGSIDSNPVFSFYTEKSGVYSLQQVDAEKSSIRYSNSKPRLITYTLEPVDPSKHIMNYFALDFIGKKRYLFLIPKGSIKNDYTLDAN